jgi:hypothetical protein
VVAAQRGAVHATACCREGAWLSCVTCGTSWHLQCTTAAAAAAPAAAAFQYPRWPLTLFNGPGTEPVHSPVTPQNCMQPAGNPLQVWLSVIVGMWWAIICDHTQPESILCQLLDTVLIASNNKAHTSTTSHWPVLKYCITTRPRTRAQKTLP